MAYTTDFYGSFKLSRPATLKEYRILADFCSTRHSDGVNPVPSIWCQWILEEDSAETVEWDGNEGFTGYTEWIQYLYDNFFKPWGIELSGTVFFQGEEIGDFGGIIFKDGKAYQINTLELMDTWFSNRPVDFVGKTFTYPEGKDDIHNFVKQSMTHTSLTIITKT